MLCSALVREPWWPIKDDSRGSTVRRTMVAVPRAAATTSPIRDRTSSRTWSPNQPAAIASSRDATHARSVKCLPPRGENRVARAFLYIDVPGPWLAADGRHPVEERGAIVDVDDVVPGGDHAVVGDDGEQTAGRQTLDQRLDQAVDLP